jgi:hypothetical protein
MYIYMYIYMYAYIYTQIISIHIDTHTYIYIHVRIHLDMWEHDLYMGREIFNCQLGLADCSPPVPGFW